MKGTTKPIEDFFLVSILKICLASILIVMAVDFYYTNFVFTRSLIIDLTIFFSIVSSFFLYRIGLFKASVIWTSFMVTAAMIYQSLNTNTITTSSMAVIMVIGLGYSILLKGKLPWLFHSLTVVAMISVFAHQSANPLQFGKSNSGDIIVAGVTYTILYLIIGFSSWILKQRYDDALKNLASNNTELIEQANEIETQNEELMQSQESLHSLNLHLENLVAERTKKVLQQNEQLLKYAYSNAHHMRGPVARLLGLIQLSKLESHLDYPFLFKKIEQQTVEIDDVIKSINKELETSNENN
jgi:signal transduction histidine kinase